MPSTLSSLNSFKLMTVVHSISTRFCWFCLHFSRDQWQITIDPSKFQFQSIQKLFLHPDRCRLEPSCFQRSECWFSWGFSISPTCSRSLLIIKASLFGLFGSTHWNWNWHVSHYVWSWKLCHTHTHTHHIVLVPISPVFSPVSRFVESHFHPRYSISTRLRLD